jgi:oligoendopeptidase F
VETIRTTIYRQTLFAEFELAVHTAAEQGTPLTADFFQETYEKLVKTYYGEHFTLGKDDGMEWAYIPHFYYKYYVFTYATGLSSGIALAERVKAGTEGARDAYLGMLQGGSSKPPLDLLRDAGVDLTKPDAIEGAAKLLDSTLAKMENLINKKP